LTIVDIIARINEPKAKDPKLYLKDHQNPSEILKSPFLYYVLEKYHKQTPTIKAY